MRILKGREKIHTDMNMVDLQNPEVLCKVINQSFSLHLQNKSDIDYLINYKKGIQPVMDKIKPIRGEINNKLVVNHAQMITRNIIGYFLGSPIQYIQNGYSNKKEQIDKLNRYVQYEDKASVDKEIGEYQSICGTAYRIIYKDGMYADEVPFEDRALNPSNTFVVYENGISQQPVMAVTYHNVYDEDGKQQGIKMYTYTMVGLYTLLVGDNEVATPDSIVSFSPYNVGGVPIIEYPNNMWRLGDWELCIGLMDAINDLQSGRLDDIDQIVQSLLVFINADLDEDTYDEMRDAGVVMLKNNTGAKSEVKSIQNSLDQSGMNMFSQEMEDLLYALIGIPSRNNRAGGGGDTGQAVELRDGWADLEIIARNKELTYKKSEKQTLKIILNMFNAYENENLSMLDIDIKFSRNKSNNLLVKTQAYQTLIATRTLDPADCLTIVDLVSDVNEYMTRGKLFWKDEFAQSDKYSLGKGEDNNKEDGKDDEEVEDIE